MMDDTANPAHKMKAITDAVKESGAKTVSVTVFKDGQKMTFKAARSLRGYKDSYNGLDIQSADRQKFESAFDRYTDYTADEVIHITYDRNTIYEAAPAMDEDVSHNMEQSM